MNWTEVLRISASGIPLGVSSDGEWGFLDREWQWAAPSVWHPPSLVSVLESGPQMFVTLLRARLAEQHLDPRLAEHFPVLGAVRMALIWIGGSGRWQAQTSRWVESLHAAAEFEPELRTLVQHGSTQAIRHLARRLLRTATA